MKPLIIGTAGHVDHGKSTLIKALTGIDPDRLREEQQRGMTIDLGFAWIDLPDVGRVGIVDVPGHERFLKNMLAGAGGVDLALLVVAADEGVMPQTLEHLDILSLLDVRGLIVALTKTDLADEDMRALVREEALEMVAKRGLPAPVVVEVSATSGAGLEDLSSALANALSEMPARDKNAPARMPIDRVFTMTGFGTVVTGTLVSGTLREGDQLKVFPGGWEARVRGLQVHGLNASEAVAGQRVAVNVAGAPKDKLERGQALASPGACEETSLADAVIRLLPGAPALRHQNRVRVHIGTAEALARVALNPSGQILEEGAAQLLFESPVACAKGDRFVLRRYSPGITVGGGVIVVPVAKRRKRATIDMNAFSAGLRSSPEEAILNALRAETVGYWPRDLAVQTGLSVAAVQEAIAGMELVSLGGRLVAPDNWPRVREGLLEPLRKFHADNPAAPEMAKAAWLALTPLKGDARAADAALARMDEVTASGAGVRLSDFEVKLAPKQEALLRKVEEALLAAGIRVPTVNELTRLVGLPLPAVQEMLRLGRALGKFARVSDELYYPVSTLEPILAQVRAEIEASGKITAARFRDMTDTSRKYAVPLLEYMDEIRLTRRVGDDRVLN